MADSSWGSKPAEETIFSSLFVWIKAFYHLALFHVL
jgi:hypothetical protein